MIKNIVLDMGNVCCRWDMEYLADCLAKNSHDKKIIIENVFQSRQWQLLDAGVISLTQAEKEILKKVNDDDCHIIKKALYHWHDYFDQYDNMEQNIIKWKKEGYRIYLLSNCSMQFYDYYQNKSIFSHFDGYYISAQYHLTKPHQEIYLDFLNRFHLSANECLFIDDIQENIDGAIKAGMKGLVYRGDVQEINMDKNNG